MTTVTLTAPDISCDHCKNAIEGAVGAMNGVEEVYVLIEDKKAVVKFDPDATTIDDIKAAMDEEGYSVTDVAAGAAKGSTNVTIL